MLVCILLDLGAAFGFEDKEESDTFRVTLSSDDMVKEVLKASAGGIAFVASLVVIPSSLFFGDEGVMQI
jgi:hypothetical protein